MDRPWQIGRREETRRESLFQDFGEEEGEAKTILPSSPSPLALLLHDKSVRLPRAWQVEPWYQISLRLPHVSTPELEIIKN